MTNSLAALKREIAIVQKAITPQITDAAEATTELLRLYDWATQLIIRQSRGDNVAEELTRYIEAQDAYFAKYPLKENEALIKLYFTQKDLGETT